MITLLVPIKVKTKKWICEALLREKNTCSYINEPNICFVLNVESSKVCRQVRSCSVMNT